MRHTMAVLAVALSLVCAGIAHAAPAAAKARNAEVQNTGPTVASDVLEGAPYRIEIPAHWSGELVMLLHGYEPKGAPRQQPWPQNEATPVFLARGYAVAESAYRTQGWSVAEALPDIERLRQHFVATYGKPRRTYVAGFSLGGHLALASLEQHANAYSGALSLCGVNLPAGEIFDEGIVTPLVALAGRYPELVRTAGRAADLTVLPAVGEGHCNFTPTQIDTAFSALVDRAGGGKTGVGAGNQTSH